MRKETLHKYKSLAQKSDLKILISVTSTDSRCRGGVETVSSFNESWIRIEARSIDQVSRRYRGDRNFLDRSTSCREGVEIAIRKHLKSSIDSQLSRGVEQLSGYLSAGVELSVHLYWTPFLHLFLGPIFMALILDLNNMFLEVLNTS